MGLIRLVFSALVGGVVFALLPQAGVLAATQEIIAFLSLLMAGLLPAMIVTATILRGGSFSARRIEEYGGALEKQLMFWAVLFVAAGTATAAIVFAKVFSAPTVSFDLAIWKFHLRAEVVVRAALALGGAGVGVVLYRLRPAFQGLISLLHLNVATAKGEALVNDRSRRDSLVQQAQAGEDVKPYGFQRTD